MFKNTITETAFTTDGAEAYFTQRIPFCPVLGDDSFISTLRALLDSRLLEAEPLVLQYTSSSRPENTLKLMTPTEALKLVFGNAQAEENCLYLLDFRLPSSANAWMDLVESSFEQQYPGWHRIEKVTLFYAKTCRVLCFVNTELKSSLVVVADLDIKTMHYIQTGIPAYLPWYFNEEAGVTETEMELLQSLREKTSAHYEACIAKLAQKYDFEADRIRILLSGFETRYEQMQCADIRDRLSRIEDTIADLNNKIGSYLTERRDKQEQLLGLELSMQRNSGNSEIMDYFLCNKHLHLIKVDNSTMTFVVTDYLTYFDEDLAARVINNSGSYIYDPSHVANTRLLPRADMKMLMTALFIEQTLKIKFCAAYSFTIDESVRGLSGFAYGPEAIGYMPNPHINRYGCLGNYGREINNRLYDHDYIGALEQAVASCKSLNLGDTPVMNEFMRQLYGCADAQQNNRCIELPSGEVVTMKQAVAYLKAQEVHENGETN